MTTPTDTKRRRIEPPPPPNLTTSGLSICRNCNLVFRNESALEEHSKTENHKMVLDGLRPPFGAFFCLLCWVGFKSMDDLRTHYNRETHENNTFQAKVKAIWTGASNSSSSKPNLAAELPSNVSPISPDRSLSPISLEEADEVLPTPVRNTTSNEVGPFTTEHLNGRHPVIQNSLRENNMQSAESTTKQDINSANSSPNFHKSKDNAIDDFVILDEVGDEQVPTSSLDINSDDRDDISLSEVDDQDLEKVSSDEDENADDESFENISSPEHVTNHTGPKLDFENVDSPEEHAAHEDLEAVDSPEEDPEEGYKPPEFGRGLEQSLEAVSSPEPDDAEAETNNETNASTTPTPEEVKDQSDSSNLDADLLLMDQNLELIYD